MTYVTVWGCSDDLLEIEGDVSEEFNPRDSFLVLFSDGLVIKGTYDGDWNLNVDIEGSSTTVTRHRKNSPRARELTHGRDYSDAIEVNGEFDWVTVCERILEVPKK